MALVLVRIVTRRLNQEAQAAGDRLKPCSCQSHFSIMLGTSVLGVFGMFGSQTAVKIGTTSTSRFREDSQHGTISRVFFVQVKHGRTVAPSTRSSDVSVSRAKGISPSRLIDFNRLLDPSGVQPPTAGRDIDVNSHGGVFRSKASRRAIYARM